LSTEIDKYKFHFIKLGERMALIEKIGSILGISYNGFVEQ
jgi:hypothetical protein